MYSTCLFCAAPLGRNEAIEAFPVGRRLAFDGAKGRLWVVCRRCERWNLTPLEERWEAIDECERAFRSTRLRVSTDEIGLAKLREGLELVRIGDPQRPEMAAWRYGDQFGRRRRKALVIVGGIAVAGIGWAVVGPVMGIVGVGSPVYFSIANAVHTALRNVRVAARVPLSSGETLDIRRSHVDAAQLRWTGSVNRWSLDVAHRPTASDAGLGAAPTTTNLVDDDALRAARLLLPAVNAGGAWRGTVADAVEYLGDWPDVGVLFARVARTQGERDPRGYADTTVALNTIPAAIRLALEMAAHEETERRALEGELHLLASAWRDAEEVAAIADDMFLPASVDEELARLKRERE